MVDGSAMVIDYAIVLLFDKFLKSLEALVKKGYGYCNRDFMVFVWAFLAWNDIDDNNF